MKPIMTMVMVLSVLAVGSPLGAARAGDTLNLEPLGFWAPMPNASASAPSARIGVMVYDRIRRETLLHGGLTEKGAVLSDTWAWNGLQWSLRAVGPDVFAPGIAFDMARGVAVLFGGAANGSPKPVVRATWVWDGTSWAQVATNGPTARHTLAMAYDPIGQRVLLHGGTPDYDMDPIFSDTWAWDGESWTRIDGAGGPSRAGHAMVFDEKRGVMVLFGGIDARGSAPVDTWEFYDNQWHQVATSGPPGGRQFAMLGYDTDREVTVMTGGGEWGAVTHGFPASKYYTDTWEWDGSQWRQRYPVQPRREEVLSAAAAWDAARGRWVMFGGAQDVGPNLTTVGSTWEYGLLDWIRMGPPSITEEGLSLTWTGGVPPMQVETCTSLPPGDSFVAVTPTAQREMIIPMNGSQQSCRVVMKEGVVSGREVHVMWVAQPPATELPSGNSRAESWERVWYCDADDDRLDGYVTVIIDALFDPQGALLEAGGSMMVREQLDTYTYDDFLNGTFDANLVIQGHTLWEGRWTLHPPENTVAVAAQPSGLMAFYLHQESHSEIEHRISVRICDPEP